MIKSKKKKIPTIVTVITEMLLLLVLLSLLADYYWTFDLLSHFVVHYTVISAICLVVLLLYKKHGLALVALAILLSQGYKISPLLTSHEFAEGKGDQIKILQYNVNQGNKNVEEMTKWIISQSEDVDIVVLFETNEKWQESLRRIKWAYPYHISKNMRDWRNMVIFSRLYIDDMEVKYLGEANYPALVLRGETTGYEIPFVLYGVHPPPPIFPSYKKARDEILMAAGKAIAEEDSAHKLLIADMNTTRFSPSFSRLSKTSNLKDSFEGLGLASFYSTWPGSLGQFFGITIDHLLVSDNIQVISKETGSAMGSDHRPVITTMKFMANGRPSSD